MVGGAGWRRSGAALKRPKPFCRICKTTRLPQTWNVIDGARISHQPMPVCSKECRAVAAKRARRRAPTRADERTAAEIETRLPRVKPSSRFPIVDESGRKFGRRKFEESEMELAEKIAMNRRAAREWMIEVECADYGETVLQNRADAVGWMV